MDKTLSDAILVANQAGLTDRELASVVEAATVARRAEGERPGLVPLTHPDLPDRPPYLADPEAVEVYLRSGWTVLAAEPPEDEAAEDAAPKPTKAAKAAAKKETP
jgi:hypothetical protein